jgi:cyanophycin synthetase
MEIQSIQTLHGPNVWAEVPVLEARVACGPRTCLEPEALKAFHERLVAWLPGLAARRALRGAEADSDVRCHPLADALRDVTLELQTLARTPVSAGQACATDASGVYQVVVEYEEEKLGRACLESACRFCMAAANAEVWDVAAELRRLRALAEDVCLGPWVTGPIVAAARARGIPFRRLDDVSLVQLGHGARRQRIHTAFTERTGRIAEWVSLDKDFTKALLREVGLPVPTGRTVGSAEEAWTAALDLGLPVAIKPRSADYGRGVGLKLTTRAQVVAAYAAARQYRDEVLVEQYVQGEQYRVMVVGEKVVAAAHLELLRLTADGRSNITQLIEQANQDPRRSDDGPWDRITPDDDTLAALAEQGLAYDSVPPAGMEVVVSRLADPEAGARVEDVTDSVHPLVAADCVTAVRLLGLDLAGLDVIASDIRQPLEEQGGVILEVNAKPAIALHFPPLCDRYRPVCEAIVELLFPPGQTGRIPLATVTGTGDNATVGRWLAQLLQGTGQGLGRASSDGLFLNARRLKPGDQANLAGGRALLLCPEVEAAVLERSRQSIRWEGLGWDRCDVAVVTNLGRTNPRLDRSPADPDLARAAHVAVEAAVPHGAVVIDVADPAAATIAASHPGAVILVSALPDHPLIAAGRRPKYPSVILRGSDLVFSARRRAAQLIPLDPRQLAEIASRDQMPALLAAVAAAWAMQVPLDAIRTGLHALVPG